MKAYPENNIKYNPVDPLYVKNTTPYQESRYSPYRIIDNQNNKALEIKLASGISKNDTYKGYYYTTVKNETLYEIAKKYYDNEKFYWVIAKANGIKDDLLSVVPPNTTVIVPNISELQKEGGYYTVVGKVSY